MSVFNHHLRGLVVFKNSHDLKNLFERASREIVVIYFVRNEKQHDILARMSYCQFTESLSYLLVGGDNE